MTHFPVKAVIFSFFLSVVLGVAADPVKVQQPPPEFLRTDSPGWKRILAREVSVNFDATEFRDAIEFIVSRSDANVSVQTGDERPPKVSGRLERVPFRTALYWLARKSGATVTWELEADGRQRGIVFKTK